MKYALCAVALLLGCATTPEPIVCPVAGDTVTIPPDDAALQKWKAIAAVRAGVSPEAIDTWLAAVKAPLLEKLTPVFDAGLFAAQRNVRNLLFSIFVQLSSQPKRGAGEQVLLDKLAVLLAE